MIKSDRIFNIKDVLGSNLNVHSSLGRLFFKTFPGLNFTPKTNIMGKWEGTTIFYYCCNSENSRHLTFSPSNYLMC